jgi:pyruvate,orthophosphate dikinase
VVGASSIRIDLNKREMVVNGKAIKEGEWISVDGTTGEVFAGKLAMKEVSIEKQTDLLKLLDWADEICARPGTRKFPEGWPTTGLQVWANADYPADARRARSYGAKGIGLCRTSTCSLTGTTPDCQRMNLAKLQGPKAAWMSSCPLTAFRI